MMARRQMRFAALGLALSCAIAAVGCKGKAPSAPVPPPKSAPAAQAAPLKEQDKIERQSYEYDVKGRRDPFQSLVEVAKAKPKRAPGKKPIENVDVDEILVSAIISDNKDYYALVTLPDKKSYTIRKGMTLGLYGGRVEDISKNGVLIREQVKDYRGNMKMKDTLLKLRKEGEE